MYPIPTRVLVICLALICGAVGSSVARADDLNLSANIRVRTAMVAPIPVGGRGLATGVVSAYRKATVAAEIPGRITERLVEPGTIAETGQTLVHIDADRAALRLRQAEAMAEAARVELQHASHEFRRSERLLQKSVVSQDTVDDLRFGEASARARLQAALVEVAAAKRELRDAKVAAPFAGQIEAVHVQVGDYVNPGQPVVTQTDFSKVRIIAGVTGREATRIRQGDTATTVFEDLGGTTVDATVTSVGRVKDQITGTYPVELVVSVADIVTRLREGMIGAVSWHNDDAAESTLSVPSAALVRHEGKIRTYIVEGGKAYQRDVRIGRSDGQRVEILAGLQAGQEVVIEGQFALREGAAVTTSAMAGK